MKKSLKLTLTVLIMLSLITQACKVKDYQSNSKPLKHDLWHTLVQKHVSAEGEVNYKGFIQDSLQLNQYLDQLSANHPSDAHWNEGERMAFWINAYNAFTVKLVVDHYPLASIKDIKKGIPFINTVWDIKFIKIENATYDLNNIEHGILRAKFKDPRVHFVLNCASKSCPKLLNEAITAERLDEQLTQAAKDFLSDSFRNRLSKNKVELSKIFSWYRGDFKDDGSVIDYINQYAVIKINKDADIDYIDYDWNLNE